VQLCAAKRSGAAGKPLLLAWMASSRDARSDGTGAVDVRRELEAGVALSASGDGGDGGGAKILAESDDGQRPRRWPYQSVPTPQATVPARTSAAQ
jgi:hypothetical protein